jgi:hypothetical protein
MDEHLTNRLAVLEADVIRTVRLAPVEAVRAYGDRRRRWWTTRAFAAVVAILTAVGLGAGGVGLMAAGGRDESWTAFPAAFTMPHEGEEGWVRDDNLAVASPFNPCHDPDVTLTGRIMSRRMTGYAFPEDPAPVKLVEQLVIYENEAAARAAMSRLRSWAVRDAAHGCRWIGGVYDGPLDLGDDVLWSGAQLEDGWHDALMARSGVAIYISHASGGNGGTPYNEDLGAAQFVRDQICKATAKCSGPSPDVQLAPGPDPTPAPSWWDFLQTPYPNATVPYDPWEHLNPVPTPTP